MKLEPDQPNFARLVSAQVATARTVINAAIRVDEQKFRQRSNDRIAQLLDEMRRTRDELAAGDGPVIDGQAVAVKAG